MRKLSLTTAAVLLTVTSIGAQVPKLEMTRLRERLSLPATVNIATDLRARLPAGPSLKVYIATTKGDPTYWFFVESFDKWNKKDGLSYGQIQVVSDLTQSDVILVLYRSRERVPHSSTTGAGSIPGRTVSGPLLARPPLSESLPDTQYSYLITRKSDAFEIAYRDVVPLSYPDLEVRVLNQLKKRMKKR